MHVDVEDVSEEEIVVPPAVEYIEIGTDGEETEYAEYTVEELSRKAEALKAEIAKLVENASVDPE